MSLTHSTFVVKRRYPVNASRVFSAFADPELKRRWFAESSGHQLENYRLDFQVGGEEKFAYRLPEGTPVAGMLLVNEGRCLDIVSEQRIVTAERMCVEGRPISVSLTTFEINADADETELVITFQGVFFDGADGAQMRQAGWQKLAENLAELLAE